MTQKQQKTLQRCIVTKIRSNTGKLTIKFTDGDVLIFSPDKKFYYEISLAVLDYFRRMNKAIEFENGISRKAPEGN